jgi:hypothetical protein
MRRQIGLPSIIGFFGLLTAANAQAPAPQPPTRFDGTYQLVSSTKVNQMHTAMSGTMAPCPDRRPGPLTVAQGQAQYTTQSGYELRGTVGPNGELDLRMSAPGGGGSRPTEMRTAAAQIDNKGTTYARQIGAGCSYDYVWQKQQ